MAWFGSSCTWPWFQLYCWTGSVAAVLGLVPAVLGPGSSCIVDLVRFQLYSVLVPAVLLNWFGSSCTRSWFQLYCWPGSVAAVLGLVPAVLGPGSSCTRSWFQLYSVLVPALLLAWLASTWLCLYRAAKESSLPRGKKSRPYFRTRFTYVRTQAIDTSSDPN